MQPHPVDAFSPAAAIARLAALAPLDDDARAALEYALQRPRHVGPRRELVAEGQEIPEPLLILGGWAARVRVLEDGRRQILGFLLPGDLIGLCGHGRPVALANVVAVTDVAVCAAPAAGVSAALARIYSLSRAIDDGYLLAQITRLGRLNAHERIADFLLELWERLERAGLAVDGRFALPLTQETLADTLGLTAVHVNRTLQNLRREGFVTWKGAELELPDPAALRRSVVRPATRMPLG